MVVWSRLGVWRRLARGSDDPRRCWGVVGQEFVDCELLVIGRDCYVGGVGICIYRQCVL